MLNAGDLRNGHSIRLGSDIFKVVEANLHAGAGKAGSMMHAKLRNVSTGHIAERRFSPSDKVEDLPVETVRMQFLYAEGDARVFMNPQSYDQISLDRKVIGPYAVFLKAEEALEVEFFEGRPLSVNYPDVVEMAVASTGEGIHGHDTTFKDATLENGMRVLVPQFIKAGDRVRLDVESGKYLARVSQ
ncbi:MAG: elongation factor P [Elusimicrobia bacterium]|nr:elongation factor P [Elusimicrobiota bacterium]